MGCIGNLHSLTWILSQAAQDLGEGSRLHRMLKEFRFLNCQADETFVRRSSRLSEELQRGDQECALKTVTLSID